MSRRVKGTLFVDYVRMLRAKKDVDWSKLLPPSDISFLVQRIQPDGWYPMESFERMGAAILAEVAHGDLQLVRAFGRASVDGLCRQHDNLVAAGDATETLMRFQVLRRTFFDYSALEVSSLSDGEATLHVAYGMARIAEEAACWQTLGFFERLLDLGGARDVEGWFSTKTWEGEALTTLQLRWRA